MAAILAAVPPPPGTCRFCRTPGSNDLGYQGRFGEQMDYENYRELAKMRRRRTTH
jgi:hypothetical protein